MEARFCRVAVALALVIGFCIGNLCAQRADGAGYKTTNFTVNAPSLELAKEVGDAAELWRKLLAIEWLGKEMPPWSRPCPINARVAPKIGAGGQTSFTFDGGEVFGWNMSIQGSRERILDSVLPHEITHTVFASHFRKPLPRWADEGACTTVEHQTEIAKQERMLIDFLKTRRGISFSQMFAMTEYPRDVMPLYSQGHSVSQWLIESRGRKAFLDFLADGMGDDNWPRAVEQHYGFANLGTMQDAWLDWVKAGRPRLSPESSLITQQLTRRNGVSTVSATTSPPADRTAAATAIFRGQSPDNVTPIGYGVAELQPGGEAAVAATSGSIYALSATRATEKRESDVTEAYSAPAAGGASFYDSSRNPNMIRR
jgi:hypothetical protein